ncbi:MAG: DUF4349 domain-containing protein [Candidatus Bathyarchaeia archaeon]
MTMTRKPRTRNVALAIIGILIVAGAVGAFATYTPIITERKIEGDVFVQEGVSVGKGFLPPEPVPAPTPTPAPQPLGVAGSEGPRAAVSQVAVALEMVNRKIIYFAYLNMEVDDVAHALNQIRAAAESYQGFVEQMSTSAQGERRFGTVTVRIPQQNFNNALERIEKLGKVTNMDVRAEDVSEQFIDLQARLKNAQNAEQRLLTILSKAEKVGEILEVERELARVRQQIEQLEGQLQFLDRRVELATITVNLQEPGGEDPREPNPLLTAVSLGLKALIAVAQGLIILAIVVGPFAVVGGSAYYIYKHKRAKPHAASNP